MGEWKAVGLLLAVCLAALLIPFTRLDSFVTSDLWERQRVAREILETGFVPETNNAYEPETPYVYPPAFDLLLAGALANGADYLLAVKLLSLAVGASFVLFVYLLSRKFFRPEIALMSAFLVFFMPRVFRLLMQPIPETFGLLLFTAALYFAAKNRTKLAGLLAAGLMFYHARSFFNLLLVAAILFASVSGWKGVKRMKNLVLVPLIFSPAYWLTRLPAALQAPQLVNPFLAEWSALQVLGPQALLAAFYLLFWWHYKRYKPLVNWVGIFLALYLGGQWLGHRTFSFRELTYLFVPVGLLSAALLWRLKAVNRLILPFALLFSLGYCLYVNFNPGYPLEKEGVSALATALKTGQTPVLSDYVAGYGVPGVAGRKAIIGPFLEGLPDANQRLADARTFLETPSAERARAVLRKYGAETAFLGRQAVKGWLPFAVDLKKFEILGFNKFYDNGFSQVYSPA